MLTDKQLKALINYIRCEAQHVQQYAPCPDHEVKAARRDLCAAFGFDATRQGYPVAQTHPLTLPPAPIPARPLGNADVWKCTFCGCGNWAEKTYCDRCGENNASTPLATSDPQTLPPAKHVCKCSMQDVHDYGPCGENCLSLATSDPEGHREAIASADYDEKAYAIHRLLPVPPSVAEEIMRLWTELKAIMEPNAGVLSASLAKSPVDASLIESLIRWCGGIADDDLALIAEKGHTVSRPTFTLTGNHALAILAARARLK